MKEKPNKHGIIDDQSIEDQNTDTEDWPSSPAHRNLEGRGKPKWYEMLPYEDFAPHLPQLRYVRGSKAKFSITTFQEINDLCQEIFEKNKSFFRFRVQVDLLAHYIGTKILEHLYVTNRGLPKNKLAQLLEEREKQFAIWDRMKTVKEIFASLCEKRIEGFVSEDEFEAEIGDYIATFDTEIDRMKMAQIVDILLERKAMEKAKDRTRKRFERTQEAKEKGIKAVK